MRRRARVGVLMPPYMTKPITSARGRGRGTEAETLLGLPA
jgi:hypothetical protein